MLYMAAQYPSESTKIFGRDFASGDIYLPRRFFFFEKVSLSITGLQNVKVMPPRLRFREDLRQKPLADSTVHFDVDEGIRGIKSIDDQLHLRGRHRVVDHQTTLFFGGLDGSLIARPR